MSILLDALPDTVVVGGKAWPIRSDYRVGVRFELLMQDPTVSDTDKVAQALALYYPEVPSDLNGAVEGILWFYLCGAESSKTAASGRTQPKRCYDFDEDSGRIAAAFYGAYRIDLNAVEYLHWWTFRALFRGLPADCELCRVMGYRTADTSGMGKKQREVYAKLKRQYALKNKRTADQTMSLAARDQRLKDYVQRRYQEVGQK